jgi:hypothetical protein
MEKDKATEKARNIAKTATVKEYDRVAALRALTPLIQNGDVINLAATRLRIAIRDHKASFRSIGKASYVAFAEHEWSFEKMSAWYKVIGTKDHFSFKAVRASVYYYVLHRDAADDMERHVYEALPFSVYERLSRQGHKDKKVRAEKAFENTFSECLKAATALKAFPDDKLTAAEIKAAVDNALARLGKAPAETKSTKDAEKPFVTPFGEVDNMKDRRVLFFDLLSVVSTLPKAFRDNVRRDAPLFVGKKQYREAFESLHSAIDALITFKKALIKDALNQRPAIQLATQAERDAAVGQATIIKRSSQKPKAEKPRAAAQPKSKSPADIARDIAAAAQSSAEQGDEPSIAEYDEIAGRNDMDMAAAAAVNRR